MQKTNTMSWQIHTVDFVVNSDICAASLAMDHVMEIAITSDKCAVSYYLTNSWGMGLEAHLSELFEISS